jgi:hypothetical protein
MAKFEIVVDFDHARQHNRSLEWLSSRECPNDETAAANEWRQRVDNQPLEYLWIDSHGWKW